jgi:Arc/MetJ-type ribon-helix-helix transcriptional regulator
MTRIVVPISLPKSLNLEIEKKVKKGFYSSKSEYVRKAVRESLIWEAEVAKYEKDAIKKGLKAIREGKVSKAFSSTREMAKYLRNL